MLVGWRLISVHKTLSSEGLVPVETECRDIEVQEVYVQEEIVLFTHLLLPKRILIFFANKEHKQEQQYARYFSRRSPAAKFVTLFSVPERFRLQVLFDKIFHDKFRRLFHHGTPRKNPCWFWKNQIILVQWYLLTNVYEGHIPVEFSPAAWQDQTTAYFW